MQSDVGQPDVALGVHLNAMRHEEPAHTKHQLPHGHAFFQVVVVVVVVVMHLKLLLVKVVVNLVFLSSGGVYFIVCAGGVGGWGGKCVCGRGWGCQ